MNIIYWLKKIKEYLIKLFLDKNPEIINLMLNDKRFEAFKEKEDLLGRDPLQIAINNDNQYFIDQIK